MKCQHEEATKTISQPGKKVRRRKHRLERAAELAPRPVDKLRPIVRCPTVKYNRKIRAGRGFTFAELKVGSTSSFTHLSSHQRILPNNLQEAGISRKLAPTIGISVDYRRANLSMESLTTNVARLKAYKERLILFPRRRGQHKQGDASKDEIAAIRKEPSDTARKISGPVPIVDEAIAKAIGEVKKSQMPKGEENAYMKLSKARSDARLVGVREKKAKAEAEAAEAKK